MRPIRLAMSAFGPFAGAQVIEFEKLGENPLFLINGPTGSGKTTILDAICFALYGETTGQDRDPREMRSQQASPSTLTEVDFEFELGGQRYRITRVPEQERPKARGEGTTNQAARATFAEIRPDGSETVKVERKVTDANEAVVELTGLSADQFRQVMVLPQGRFREFLLADSRKREEIFEQLFQTQIYSRIEDRLKESSAELRKQRMKQHDRREGVLQSVGRESVEVLREEITALEPKVAEAQEKKQAAEKALQDAQTALTQGEALAERFAQLGKQKTALADLESQAEEFKALEATIKINRAALTIEAPHQRRIDRQAALTKAKTDHAEARSKLEKARAGEQAAQKASKAAQGQREALEASRQSQRTLEGLKDRVVALGQAQANAEKRASERAEAETALEASNTRSANADAASKEAATALEDAHANVAGRPAKAVELEKLQSTIGRLEQRNKLNEQISTLGDEVKQMAAEADGLKCLADEASDAQKRTEHAWHVGQARLLAAELADGEPCPVCGSLEHPHLASGDEPVPDEVAVEQARAAAAEARERWQAQDKKLVEHRAELKSFESQLTELAGELSDNDKLNLDDLREQAATLEKALAALVALDEEIPALEAKAAEAAERLEAAQKAVNDCKDVLQDATVEEAKATQALTAAKDEVPEDYRAEGALESALEGVAAEQDKLVAAFQAIDQALSAAKEALTRAETALEGAASEETQSAQQLEQAEEAWQAALKKAGFREEADFLAARKPSEEVDVSEERLKGYRSQVDAARGALNSLETELKDQAAPDLAALSEQVDAKASARHAADEAHSELAKQRDQLTSADETIVDIEAKISALDDEYRVVGTLGDITNGRNGKNLSLQRFVLSVLLEDVLEQASVRLRLMSKGRYDLCRAEAARGRSASGLELEVLDAYTGGSRSVSTLSGGESFMAALALALGLSDVVQAYAGGIRLDALFIDEGFGSLDAESLDLAINTLIDLRQSGRMVGIISHVSELKERIDVRMDVRTGRHGASVEVHA